MAHVVLHQDSIAVFERPDAESPTLTRLSKGTPFIMLDTPEAAHPGWLAIRTEEKPQGFIKNTAKITTAEQLRQERQDIQRGRTMGWRWIGLGSLLFLAGAAVTLLSLMSTIPAGNGGYIWYGAVGIGLAMIVRGLEQLSHVKYTLKKFDETYSRAL